MGDGVDTVFGAGLTLVGAALVAGELVGAGAEVGLGAGSCFRPRQT